MAATVSSTPVRTIPAIADLLKEPLTVVAVFAVGVAAGAYIGAPSGVCRSYCLTSYRLPER